MPKGFNLFEDMDVESIHELKQVIESFYARKVMLDDGAIMPTKAHPSDAAFDLYSVEEFWLNPGDAAIVNTGVHVEVRDHEMGVVAPRSGLTFNDRIVANVGIVDSWYTGPIKVSVENHGTKQYRIKPGDRIAQIIWVPIDTPDELMLVDSFDESDRGDDGFGSSGK